MKSAPGSLREMLCLTLLEQSAVAISIRAPDGGYLLCNPRFDQVFGKGGDVVGGGANQCGFTADVLTELADAVADVAGCGDTRRFKFVHPVEDELRRFHVTSFPLRDDHGEIFAVASSFADLGPVETVADPVATDLAEAEQRNEKLRQALVEMELLASTDRLTGAWNRRRFEDAAVIEMARSERYGHQVSLLLLDLDHFKQVNDQHGHSVGDRVLKAFVEVVGGGIRKSDSIARWGGEEFIVLARNTRLPEARRLAEKMRLRISGADFAVVGRLTASIGVAEYQRGEGLEGWLARADRALYDAKSSGRNRVVADAASAFSDAAAGLPESLMQLVWREAYRSGHPLIDAQHERLFALANRLLDDIANSAPRDDILETIALLVEEALRHFGDEEAIHRETTFAEAEGHALEHRRLMAKAKRLSAQVGKGLLSPYDMFRFLAYEVVAQHVLGSDRRFASFLQQRAAH